MANQPQQPPPKPPSSPPAQPPRPQQPPQHQQPSQPLQPPLPPAQSSPPRQPAPDPSPQPDPPRDQRGISDREDVGTTLTPEQRTGLVTEPHPPQKFKRPLPQPGDNDYVAGQPVNEEEAARVEKEDEERYARGQAAAQEAIARRQDARTDDQEGEQHPGTPAPKHPDDRTSKR